MPSDHAFQTLSIAIVAGAFITVVSRKLQLPTIVFLFAGGAALGPSGLAWVQPDRLGPLLSAIVALAIGIILFEGGLTLDPRDYLRSPKVIKRLLTVGAVVTWLGSTLAVRFALGASWPVSLLAGSLVIVTGPTVILPLLKRLRLQPRIASVLHWEGVLIDAVGVFLAVLCYELVTLDSPATAVAGFAGRVAVGAAIGIAGGLALQKTLEKRWVPESLTNPFVLGSAVFIFAVSEFSLHESGLLSVTLAGIVVGRRRSPEVRQIQTFKAELSDLLIGALFILLVGRLNLLAFLDGGWPLVFAVAAVLLLVRPLNIFLSAWGSDLSSKERVFLSWVAPRGIVAASMASLFALQLGENPRYAAEARILEIFTFSVIAATVVLQGLTAGDLAKKLGLKKEQPNSWLIVGAHRFGRELAKTMRSEGGQAFLLDNNPRNIATARAEGLDAFEGDARDPDALLESEQLPPIGYLLALTDNSELNLSIAGAWRPTLGKDRAFAWSDESKTAASSGSRSVSTPFALLPRPAIVSEELRHDTARLFVSAGEVAAGGIALFCKNGNGFLPSHLHDGSRLRISLVRQGGYLARALARGGELSLTAQTLDELYQRLCDSAVARQPRIDRDALLADLRAQEQIIPPFLGNGVVMPHAYSSRIAERLCIKANLAPPIAAPGIDEPITLAYFIVSPVGDPQGHLATLAEIARQRRKATAATSSAQPTFRYADSASTSRLKPYVSIPTN